jgi:glycosyltransferase involved in cell wall biosynthesis
MPLVYVPPSLRGSYKPESRPDYLARKFNLGPGQTIVLSAGGIADYYLVEELAQEAREWPAEWTLVIHGPFRVEDPYHARVLRHCDGKKVIASRRMLGQAELDAMVASAHVGLALYKDVSPNQFHITSGKLMQYLRCGVPVVATDFPNLKEVVEKHGCGLCVRDPSELLQAILSLMAEYPAFRTRAARIFDEQFRFDIHFGKVLQRMEALVAPAGSRRNGLAEADEAL